MIYYTTKINSFILKKPLNAYGLYHKKIKKMKIYFIFGVFYNECVGYEFMPKIKEVIK